MQIVHINSLYILPKRKIMSNKFITFEKETNNLRSQNVPNFLVWYKEKISDTFNVLQSVPGMPSWNLVRVKNFLMNIFIDEFFTVSYKHVINISNINIDHSKLIKILMKFLKENNVVIYEEYGTYTSESFIFTNIGLISIWCLPTERRIKLYTFNKRNIESFIKKFKNIKNKNNFVFLTISTSDGIQNEIAIQVKKLKFDFSLYPYFNITDIKKFYSDYLKSSAGILFLQGVPGTGKTNFIKSILSHAKNKKIIFSTCKNTLNDHKFYSRANTIFILEDFDEYIIDKKLDNKIMNTLLNSTAGLNNVNSKFIISTNLSLNELQDTDCALLRPGRCFKVLKFEKLNYADSLTVINKYKLNKEIEKGKTYSLAELFNDDNNSSLIQNKIGF